jgi:hypothetical protein
VTPQLQYFFVSPCCTPPRWHDCVHFLTGEVTATYGIAGVTRIALALSGASCNMRRMDSSCLCVSRLCFSAQRRQRLRCKAVVSVSTWRSPKQLFHNGQNHPRILSVLASSRSEEATQKGMEKSFQRRRRQTVDFKEIDALAAASGATKALALGRKYSICVNGALFSRVLSVRHTTPHTHSILCGWQQNPSRAHQRALHSESSQHPALQTLSVFLLEASCSCTFIFL